MSSGSSTGSYYYEFLGILSGSYADTEINALVSQLEETIKKHAENVHYVQNLGRRKLAYPINHQGHGTYVLIEFDANGDAIKKLDRVFRLTNELLRHCIVRRKTIGKPIQFERREEITSSRTTTPRKVLGEELLGETPSILRDDASRSGESATVASAAPLESARTEEVTATPEEPTPIPSASPSATDDVIPTTTPLNTPAQDDETADESSKKKNKKVSYEELDKKLNELLSDDIL